MAIAPFVHLHNHSEFSLLDGACRMEEMVDWAVKNSAPAIALTDHGNMFGAYDFYKAAKDKGINPILGCEVYVAPDSRTDRQKGQKPYHLTLLAEDMVGYQNLMKLVSLAYIEGFYSKPRIDMEILRAHNQGLIVLTGCINGFVPALIGPDQNRAVANLKSLIDIVGRDNVFVEIQNHGLSNEVEAMPDLIKIAQEFNLPLVGTNDSHYLTQEHHDMHDVLLCVQMGKARNDQNRLRFDNQFYLKTIDEMHQVFIDYPPEVITNTLEIANRCQVKLDYDRSIMPETSVPEGYTEMTYLKKICQEGLQTQVGTVNAETQDRLDYELSIIEKTDYAGYFLIVWDYVNYARNQGFPLNARGSAGGSLALYALGVTTFDPMEYNCIFERFLNLERFNPPDIDIDFAPEHRDLVIKYLVDCYGEESVGYVAAFNSLGAKQAIRDVGRVLDIPLSDVDRVVKLIPSTPGITLDDALEEVPEFNNAAREPQNQEVMEFAQELEGMKRHVSIHASGIVLANGPLTDYVPLFKDKSGRIATQFEFKTIESIGMVKFDFLGLRTLSEVHNCLERIHQRHGIELKLTDIPFDDEKTYAMISKGLVGGLFQLETSPGMRRVIIQLQPDKFEDFIPIPALYRPGPLDSGMMDSYIRRKIGLEAVSYLHPLLEKALSETYGVCIYQEQVMQIAQDLAGFTLGEADVLRYAMGKKNAEMLRDLKEKFVQGSLKNGVEEAKSVEIFEYLEPFGRYAFNKSHTVAYAILSYQMAYLKTHYTREFMAAMMTGESAYSEKIMKYIAECKKLADFLQTEIKVLPPDINSSETTFTIDGNDIRFGLAAVKNVSENVIEGIVEARSDGEPFSSLQDFCERIDSKLINKRAIESLIQAGAFDNVGDSHRAQDLANLDRVMKAAQSTQQDRDKGQISLFGESEETNFLAQIELTEVEEWTYDERLKNEKEMLGFYLSGHPLEQYDDIIEYYTTATSQTLAEHTNGTEAHVVAMIAESRVVTTKKGEQMAIVVLEDLEGTIPAVVFPDTYKTSVDLIEEGNVVWLRGNVGQDRRRDDDETQEEVRQLQINEVLPINEVIDKMTSAVEILIANEDLENQVKLDQLNQICNDNRGEHNLVLRLAAPKFGEIIAQCGQRFNLPYTETITREIEDLFGNGSIKPSNRTKRNGKQSKFALSPW